MAASATFALKAGVWFRRGRRFIVSPDSLGTACPLSGRNSTYRPVQILEAGSTVDGLGNLFGVMGQQQNLQDIYDDPEMAFGPEGVAAGNDALSAIFGSPDVSRAVIDQAQNFSGVSSNILKKMLPVLAGVVLSGLMRSGTSGKATSPGQPAPSGGSLGDILGQIFGRGMSGSPSAPADPGQKFPPPASQPPPLPTDAGGQATPGGDLLGSILREFEKGISPYCTACS